MEFEQEFWEAVYEQQVLETFGMSAPFLSEKSLCPSVARDLIDETGLSVRVCVMGMAKELLNQSNISADRLEWANKVLDFCSEEGTEENMEKIRLSRTVARWRLEIPFTMEEEREGYRLYRETLRPVSPIPPIVLSEDSGWRDLVEEELLFVGSLREASYPTTKHGGAGDHDLGGSSGGAFEPAGEGVRGESYSEEGVQRYD